MHRLLFLLCALLLSGSVYSQVTTGVNVTGRHLRLLQKGKAVKEKKDSKEQKVKRTRDQAKAAKDTLTSLDSAHLTFEKPDLRYDSLSVQVPEMELPDSVRIGEPVLPNQDVAVKAEEKASEILTNQTGLSRQAALTESSGLEGQSIDQPDIPGVSDKGLGLDPNLGGTGSLSLPPVNLNPGAMNMAKMKELMNSISFDKLDDAHLSMKELKEKYSEVPSVADTSTWVKSRSLKGQPVIDRFYLGGNLAITSTDPFAMDINLQLGFKINRQLSAGVGVIWRETLFSKVDSTNTLPTSTHGWSVFTRYKFGKGFFTWGEFSTLQNTPILGEGQQSQPWQNQYLLGIGREFDIANFIKMSITVLHDFNYRHNDLHPRPFIVRIGYTIERPHFKGRK